MSLSFAPHGPSSLPFRPDAPWLAPLAGWSDLPFRLLCRECGAAVCCTEMISAKGLVYGGRNTEELLATTPEDSPLVVQLFGAEPGFMAEAARLLRERGFSWFDVNMGCSVPKVTKTGAGSALLKHMDAALAVGEAVIREAGPGKAGFKLRLGWEAGREVYAGLAAALAKLGAGWITLHPRYARQGFAGEARKEAVAELVRLLPVPVIASGDLFTAGDGLAALRETGAATVMYGRGALASPAIFAEHMRLLHAGGPGSPAQFGRPGQPEDRSAASPLCGADGRVDLGRLIRRYVDLARAHAPRTALLKMRTALPRFVRNMDGARALRQRLIACTDWESLEHLLDEYFPR